MFTVFSLRLQVRGSFDGMADRDGEDADAQLLATHVAAARNNVQELEELMAKGESLVNDSGETPLHAAARTGSNDTLRWLQDNGTVPPLAKAKNDNTAAHYAAVYGHLGALKVGRRLAASLQACAGVQMSY